MSKPGADPSSGISVGDVLRLPTRHPAYRRREAQLALVYGAVDIGFQYILKSIRRYAIRALIQIIPSNLKRLTKEDAPADRGEHRQAAKHSCAPSINVKHKVDLHLPHSLCCLNIMRFGEARTCRDFTFICPLPIRIFQMTLAATPAILLPHIP